MANEQQWTDAQIATLRRLGIDPDSIGKLKPYYRIYVDDSAKPELLSEEEAFVPDAVVS